LSFIVFHFSFELKRLRLCPKSSVSLDSALPAVVRHGSALPHASLDFNWATPPWKHIEAKPKTNYRSLTAGQSHASQQLAKLDPIIKGLLRQSSGE